MVVIVANEFDPHADAVIYALEELNFHDYLRIDLEKISEKFKFTISLNKSSCFNWQLVSRFLNDKTVTSDNIGSVWWRRSNNHFNFHEFANPHIDNVDNVESYWIVRNSLEQLDDGFFPLGHPVQLRKSENKISQLKFARLAGFLFPDTMLSNDNIESVKFVSKFSEVVIKPLGINLVKDENDNFIPLKSSINNSIKIINELNSVESNSLFIQEPVKKIADIRVTVIADNIHACYIDTSILPATEIDWRKNTFDFQHRTIKLPNDIIDKINKFMNYMNLKSAYMDFALDKFGNFYFIECNPNGQWLWIELLTSHKISKNIAEVLIEADQKRLG